METTELSRRREYWEMAKELDKELDEYASLTTKKKELNRAPLSTIVDDPMH